MIVVAIVFVVVFAVTHQHVLFSVVLLAGSDVTYLAIYDILGISASLFLFAATILRSAGTANASKRLHKELTEKVLYFPMAFFDTVRIRLK